MEPLKLMESLMKQLKSRRANVTQKKKKKELRGLFTWPIVEGISTRSLHFIHLIEGILCVEDNIQKFYSLVVHAELPLNNYVTY